MKTTLILLCLVCIVVVMDVTLKNQIHAQPELCDEVQTMAQDQVELTGILVYRPTYDTDTVRIFDAASRTASQLTLPDHDYLSLSTDDRWLLTYRGPTQRNTGESAEFWLHNVIEEDSFLLLSQREIVRIDPEPSEDTFWVNAGQLFISWWPDPSKAPDIEGIIIHPFKQPLTWEYITDRIPYQWYFGKISFNLEHMLLYRPTPSIDREYGVYTIRSGNLTTLPSGEAFTWLQNGSLSFVMRAERIGSQTQASEEIYITEYPFESFTQVTNLAETVGSVAFLSFSSKALNWSVDANRVIFSVALAPDNGSELPMLQNAGLYVYDRIQDSTMSLCIFAEDATGNRRPPSSYHWSPDSQYLAFIHNGVLYAYDISQKQLVRLIEDVSQIYVWQ
jgi:hypothetical protein